MPNKIVNAGPRQAGRMHYSLCVTSVTRVHPCDNTLLKKSIVAVNETKGVMPLWAEGTKEHKRGGNRPNRNEQCSEL